MQTKEKSNFHLETGLETLPTATSHQAFTSSHAPSLKRDHVGPVRVRKERRVSRRPARYRDNVHLDEDMDTLTTTEASVSVDSLASTSATTTPSGRNCIEELSYEEKYFRSRQQNNLASKRCREKRKAKYQEMGKELKILEERNKVLKDKVAKLTALRDQFKKFVNEVLFQPKCKSN